jgi:hypothetical protein
MDRFSGLLRGIHLLPLVVWLGGAVLLFAAVAPSAFSVLENRALAGRIVGAVINRLDLLAIVSAPVLILTALYDERTRGNPTARWVRASTLVALGTEAAISYFSITPRLVALRESPGYGTPAFRQSSEFGMLHGISLALMIFGVCCALAALYFAVRRRPLADALQVEAQA